ncbi:MAG TPA: hypothetical protein VHB79_08605 [Polyangiaceae bacterium]|nr:hypothetical protein [Polyangiaceae bacterium]
MNNIGLALEVGGTALISAVLHVLAYRQRERQPNAAAVLWGVGILMGVFSAVLWGTDTDRASRWRWLLCSLPAVMLVGHAGFLHYVRGRLVLTDTAENRELARQLLGDARDADSTYRGVIESGERYFSVEVLVLRYVVPALFAFGILYGISNALMSWYEVYRGSPLKDPSQVTTLPAATMFGAAMGLAGSYVYSMLYLGRRAFRLDITPGAASWCAVTFAIGPVLAGVLGPYVLGSNPGFAIKTDLERAALLFVAGFSPKFVVSALERIARRLLSDDEHRALPARTIPLNQVPGISREIEERLGEEGIEDAVQLAMADPYQLLRNTSFDKRQILRWIDSAILMLYLPESYAALGRRGITGAMGLTWYTRGEHKASLPALAADINLAPSILADAAFRVAADRQAQQIQVLYNLQGDGLQARAEGPPAARRLVVEAAPATLPEDTSARDK